MSFSTQLLTQAILADKITSAELETELANSGGAWKSMLRSRHIQILLANPASLAIVLGSETAFADLLDLAGPELAASDAATEIISNTSSAIFAVVTDTDYLNLWQAVPANKSRLQARVNAGGSKLIRVEYTTPGTHNYTVPAGGLLALAAAINGGGGPGASAGGSQGGKGGTGAVFKTQAWTTGIPAAGGNIEVVVGSSGQNTSITTFLTALAGNTGGNGPGSLTGPGSTSGTIFDTDPSNAIWQPTTTEQQGASGGGGAVTGSTDPGSAGTAGISGSGGSAGSGGGGGGGQGTGLCSGGGGGGRGGAGSHGTNGTAATAPGCGGGGGGSGDVTSGSGGAGGPGKATLYGVKAA
jgi:hypothetical protein